MGVSPSNVGNKTEIARVMKQYNTLKKGFETCFRSVFVVTVSLFFPCGAFLRMREREKRATQKLIAYKRMPIRDC